jgi:hypothetical protein
MNETKLKIREAIDEVLDSQLTIAVKALNNCDAAAIGSGLAKTILHYVQDLSKEFGVPSHGYPWVPGEEPKYYDDEDEAPAKETETIEDLAAAETKTILAQPKTAAEEPKVEEPKAEPKTEEPKVEPNAPTYTKQEVINILTGLNKKYGDEKQIIPTVIRQFGGSKLSDIPEEKYGELVEAAKKIAGEA